MDNIKTIQQVIKAKAKEIDASKNFIIKTTVPVIIKEPLDAGTYVTNCIVCNFTCHYPCDLANDDEKAGCGAMGKNGQCNACPSKCHWQ